MKQISLPLFFFLFSLFQLSLFADEEVKIKYLIQMDYSRFKEVEKRFGSLDVAGVDLINNKIDLVLDKETLNLFESLNVRFDILANDDQKASLEGYTDYTALYNRLIALNKKFPAITRLVNLNDYLKLPATHDNHIIWALKISDNPMTEEDEPGVAFNGNHHARELMTVEAVFDIIESLLNSYDKDPQIKNYINNLEIWCIPSMNPDGLEHVFKNDQWWRKNRRKNEGGSFGVDLNRNYPFKWSLCNGSSNTPSSDTYRGPSPASEPEVKILSALAAKKRLVVNVSYHSYGNVVLYPPYGCANAKNPVGEAELMKGIAGGYASSMMGDNNVVFKSQNRLYSVDGLDRDWLYSEFGTIAMVTEIGSTGFIPDYKTSRDKIINGLKKGWLYLLDRIFKASLNGHILDAETKKPVEATYTISGFQYFEGEKRTSEPTFGRFFLMLNPGKYTVTFKANGYEEYTLDFTLTDAPLTHEIALKKKTPQF